MADIILENLYSGGQVFVTGSNLFFACYSDHRPHDIDLLAILDEADPLLYGKPIVTFILFKGVELFAWKKAAPEDYIKYIQSRFPHAETRGYLCTFLVPGFCEFCNFTIEHLKQLKFLADAMDKKHQYLKIIYYYYLENNGFFLTQEQRDAAYAEYKRERSDINNLRY